MSALRSSSIFRIAITLQCIQVIITLQTKQQQCPLNSSSSQRCLAKRCLSCTNAPANCSMDPASKTASCAGDTSTCQSLECDSCSHCMAFYYASTDTLTDYHFTSRCISNDPTYSCELSFLNCVSSGMVENESTLFRSSPLSCSCYGNNCTANIVFHYTIKTTHSAWEPSSTLLSIQATPSVSPTTGNESKLYYIAIIILSCLLFISFLVALCIIGATVNKTVRSMLRDVYT